MRVWLTIGNPAGAASDCGRTANVSEGIISDEQSLFGLAAQFIQGHEKDLGRGFLKTAFFGDPDAGEEALQAGHFKFISL